MQKQSRLRIGIAGLGTVGASTVRLLQTHAALHETKAGATLQIAAVCARDRAKTRKCNLDDIAWVDDPRALALRDDVDIVVELMGGAEGAARQTVEGALKNGKHVVTANKALIAAHGVSLAQSAEKAALQLSFEAAVCGAIPILKTVREGLAAGRISSVRGILNGTCNYILTRMAQDGTDFSTALGEAQQKGYAEADPTDDVDGRDTANKLAVLSAVAFGTAPDLDAIFIDGIRSLSLEDLKDAAARGGSIKLLAVAQMTAQGDITQRVQPTFVPFEEPLSRVNGTGNMIEIMSDFAGVTRIGGIGAGGDATASAVVSDIIDIARGHRSFAFGVSATHF